MRALAAGAAVAGLVGLGARVLLAGRTIAPEDNPLSDGPRIDADRQEAARQRDSATYEEAVLARGIGQDLAAEPNVDRRPLLREKPREPLSALGQALPPPEPEITLFHRPVATGSASFEAMGYKLVIAGTQSVGVDEACTQGSIVWPCGMRARTAVRMWLRGRTLTCAPPPKDKNKVAVVTCDLGKQDVGAWLVSNGWARAAPDGPYAEAEAKARKAKMGIFGLPPVEPDSTN